LKILKILSLERQRTRKIMWRKIVVFDGNHVIGSFYTNADTKDEIIKDINITFGKDKWTHYHIGN